MKITVSVTLVHLVLLAIVLYFQTPKPPLLKHQPVKVHTVTLQEKTPLPKSMPSEKMSPFDEISDASTPTERKKDIKPKTSQPTVAPSSPPKKHAVKPQPIKRKEQGSHRDKLAQIMQQTLHSLEKEESALLLTTPKTVESLRCEALTFEVAYKDRLVAYLKKALTLPEKGDVKLIVCISRTGCVRKISIKEAKSDKNRSYVEATLPRLQLPLFENHFTGESEHSFSITLTSS